MRQEVLDQINECVSLANEILKAYGSVVEFAKDPKPSVGSGYDIYLGAHELISTKTEESARTVFEITSDARRGYILTMRFDNKGLYDFRKRTIKPTSLDKALAGIEKVFLAAAEARAIQDADKKAEKEKKENLALLVADLETSDALKAINATFDTNNITGSTRIKTELGTKIYLDLVDNNLVGSVTIDSRDIEKVGAHKVVDLVVAIHNLESL